MAERKAGCPVDRSRFAWLRSGASTAIPRCAAATCSLSP